VALICALPADSHTLASPVEVQLGAASASGATAIATALAPATNSGEMKLRIFMMRYSFFGLHFRPFQDRACAKRSRQCCHPIAASSYPPQTSPRADINLPKFGEFWALLRLLALI